MYYPPSARADDVDDMRFTPPALAAISVPTLIVSADRDPLYPVEMAVNIPRAALRVVPGGGHGPIFAGRERTQFAEESQAFLAGQPPPDAVP